MHILHVIPSVSAWHGGPSKAISLMESALRAQQVNVTIVATDDDGPNRRLSQLAMENQRPGLSRLYFRKWTEFYKVAPGLAIWLWRHVRDFDVVHVHALFSFSSTAAVWAARARGVPYVIRPLGTLTHYGVTQRRPLLKRASLYLLEGPMLRHAAAVHFTSTGEAAEARLLGIPLREVVIPLGVEDPCGTTSNSTGFDGLSGSPCLLFLSRLDPKKNLESLLHAISLVRHDLPGVRLLVAGDGPAPYVAALRELADTLGIASQVVWAGHVDGPLKAAAFAAADIFTLPSFSENFGVAAAEAMASGLPCLLGKGVAIAQDALEAGAGIIVEPNPQAIADGLRRIIHDPAALAEMAVRAKLLAKSRFSVDAMGTGLKNLYDDILEHDSEQTLRPGQARG